MKTRIVAIGNSQGMRIATPLLQQTGLSREVEISAADGPLVIRAARQPRDGWAAADAADQETPQNRQQHGDRGLDVLQQQFAS